MSSIKSAMIQAKVNNIPSMTEEEILAELREIWMREATAEAVAEAQIRIEEKSRG